ncbi:MAG: MAPEG family protein [Gammaproteobacteria bacterium]
MEYSAIITVLVVLQLLIFTMLVGKSRQATGVKAPAVSGDPVFERYFRVHQNSIETAVVMLPAMWVFNMYWDPRIGAGLGLVYLISRFMYLRGYVADPAKRGKGFGLGFVCTIILIVGGLIGAVMAVIP